MTTQRPRPTPRVGDTVLIDPSARSDHYRPFPTAPMVVVNVMHPPWEPEPLIQTADGNTYRMADVLEVVRPSDLDRVRAIKDFHDDTQIAYVEMLWGERTFAVHAAIRDLEAMRRGTEHPDRPLRDPETVYEAEALLSRMRWVANYLARTWGLDHRVRPEDWDGDDPDHRVIHQGDES